MSSLNESIERSVSTAVDCDEPARENDDIELILDVLFIFMSGVAIIAVFIVLVFFVVIVFDRYCGCGRCEMGWSEAEISHENYLDPAIEGPSAEAGLWSLSTEERRSVLKQLFSGRTKRYCSLISPHGLQSTCSNETLENDPNGRLECNHPTSSNASVVIDDTKSTHIMGRRTTGRQHSISCYSSALNGQIGREGIEHNASNTSCDYPMLEERHLSTTSCAVCLDVFQDGDELLHGGNCMHCFHYDCVLRWMLASDHCPYCRVEMMSSRDMRLAAFEVLDKKRVKELSVATKFVDK